MAEIGRLRYVNDGEPGYYRRRRGRGFTYLDAAGQHVKDSALRQRFDALAIPPAWTNVWICGTENGHIQATGRDEKGRKQYIYHPRWEVVRDEVKFAHMLPFGLALPALREQVEQDLRRRSLTREKVLALVVRLLDETLLRIGNEAYALENGAYGLTTLQMEHTAVSSQTITFHFPGKGGKDQKVRVTSPRLARQLKKCQELPGQTVFQYLDEEGQLQPITSTDVNNYLQTYMGQSFSAKEFRTWGATVIVATALAETEPPTSATAVKKAINQAVREAANALGNTPTVCRRYYVHPTILAAYETGRLTAVTAPLQTGAVDVMEGLSVMETAVVTLLEQSNPEKDNL
jgi:DNA topoisomerase I